MFMSTSFGQFLLPYGNSCVKTSLERSAYPSGGNDRRILARGFVFEHLENGKAAKM